MRVEVLEREEIEEKMLMTPGDIVMMLNEMGGMRVQATSPSLGAASVRIQGMRGRYTRVLSDGLPLFGEVGGLGLLQIPPMDLGQVEVIKGVASALYGAGAMGGVVNLLSRRPGAEPEREFLLNRSTRGATDAVAFLSGPFVPRLERLAAGRRPLAGDERRRRRRLGRSAGIRARRRPAAGVLGRRQRPDASSPRPGSRSRTATAARPTARCCRPPAQPYVEALETRRFDAGAVGQFLVEGPVRGDRARGGGAPEPRPSVRRSPRARSARHRVRRSGGARHGGPADVGRGAAVERDAYSPRDVPRFDYTFTVPGVFVQDDVTASSHAVALRERAARRSQRVRHVLQSARVGADAVGALDQPALGRHRLLRSDAADRRNRGRRPDASRSPRTARGRARAQRVVRHHAHRRPAVVHGRRCSRRASATRCTSSARRPTSSATCPTRRRTSASSCSATWRQEPFCADGDLHLRPGARDRRRHRTGRAADAAPQRRHRRHVGERGRRARRRRVVLHRAPAPRREPVPDGERAVRDPRPARRRSSSGRVRLFINGENLTGVRQTRWDPLLRPTRAVDGRWTVDAWAPLEGRNINGGLRFSF